MSFWHSFELHQGLTGREHVANSRPNDQAQADRDRDRADADFLVKAQQVVAGVLADPTEGPDSALYKAMGYRRKSERKSGLTRKRNTPPTTTS